MWFKMVKIKLKYGLNVTQKSLKCDWNKQFFGKKKNNKHFLKQRFQHQYVSKLVKIWSKFGQNRWKFPDDLWIFGLLFPGDQVNLGQSSWSLNGSAQVHSGAQRESFENGKFASGDEVSQKIVKVSLGQMRALLSVSRQTCP